MLSFLIIFFIEVWMIYNIVVVSGLQQSDSVKTCVSVPVYIFHHGLL